MKLSADATTDTKMKALLFRIWGVVEYLRELVSKDVVLSRHEAEGDNARGTQDKEEQKVAAKEPPKPGTVCFACRVLGHTALISNDVIRDISFRLFGIKVMILEVTVTDCPEPTLDTMRQQRTKGE